ncbi:MAG: malate dehydrogenase [Candidatus Omnitrophota bacterium]
MKITVVGAGNVGATLAMRILEADLGDVVLLDIFGDIAKGKALDLSDAAPLKGVNHGIIGTDRYDMIEGSSIVVITAGFPRKPGMSREELIFKNSGIVKEAAGNIKRFCPDSIIIVVTNPLDAMTYIAYKESGFKKNRVMGMAGVLDTSRFINLICREAGVSCSEVETWMLGSHGDTMVPVLSHTKIKGRAINEVLGADVVNRAVDRAKNRGAEIVSFLKTGSAYYAPSASAFAMVDSIVNDKKAVLPVSCFLEGEYGLKDICIGVPARIGTDGIEEIVELELDENESASFLRSAGQIKKNIEEACK